MNTTPIYTYTVGHQIILEIIKNPAFNSAIVPAKIRDALCITAIDLPNRNPFGFTDEETVNLLLAIVFGINPTVLEPMQGLTVIVLMKQYNITPEIISELRQETSALNIPFTNHRPVTDDPSNN